MSNELLLAWLAVLTLCVWYFVVIVPDEQDEINGQH
jgi:hypothetical protein